MTGSGFALTPKSSRWDSATRRRSYEGSSIVARDGQLKWTPSSERAGNAWSLTIGSESGQAAKIVHVYGLIVRSPRADLYLDRYAVLDVHGQFLAGFASGVDRFENAAWYPETDVTRLADSAGIVYGQDQVDSPQEVIDRYPGLYEHARLAKWLAYGNFLYFVPSGLLFMGLPLYYPPLHGDGPISWLLRFLAFGVGASMVRVGVLTYPPILRRYRQRMKAKHPERFASGRIL